MQTFVFLTVCVNNSCGPGFGIGVAGSQLRAELVFGGQDSRESLSDFAVAIA
jgi:hypothetical protein